MGGQDKQVAFEDPHSSASDEDAKAVEVPTNCPSISMPLHALPANALAWYRHACSNRHYSTGTASPFLLLPGR